MPTRQDFNRLRSAFTGNVAAVERLNILERQTRAMPTATGEHLVMLRKLAERTAGELALMLGEHA